MGAVRKKRNVKMVTFDQAEIVCILLEEISHSPRPEGMTAQQALMAARVAGGSQAQVDDLRLALEKASDRIMDYVVAQLSGLPGFVYGRLDGRLQ